MSTTPVCWCRTYLLGNGYGVLDVWGAGLADVYGFLHTRGACPARRWMTLEAAVEVAGLRAQLCAVLRRIRQQKAIATIVEAATAAQAVPGWGVLLEDLRPGYVPPRLPLWPVRSRARGGPVPTYQRSQWFRSVNDE